MKLGDKIVAGALLFVGGVQFIVIGLIIAEALYPGYSVSSNYISDLGVGSTAPIFNSSVFLFGLVVLFSSYFIHHGFKIYLIPVLLVLTGLAAMGVGLFPETVRNIHMSAALIAFLFGAAAAIASFKIEKPPLAYFSVVFGIIAIIALLLFAAGYDLGLGTGGMERMIVYPTVLWAIAFGGYLMGFSDAVN